MSGVSRHAANLVKGLLTRSEVSAVHLLVAPWEYKFVCDAIARADARLHIHSVALPPGTLHRNLWYYRTLPAVARQLRADVVHLAYPSPIQARAFPCPVVVTLHDLYPYDIPSNFGFPKVLFNRLILRQCLRNADAVACVSDSTKLRLGVRLPEAMYKAITIMNCVDSGPVPVKPPFTATWGDSPFLLCVAQHRRNKNVLVALRAFKHVIARKEISSDTRLLVVGMPGPESGAIHGFVRSSGLTDRTVFASGISDAEMHWCYRNCELLLAPSTAEGFGLPVVEAQLAGCRVICSDIPAFREVGGPSFKFVELGPEVEEEFARAIVASLHERRPIPADLPHFSRSAIAEQYIGLYNRVLATAKEPGVSSDTKGGQQASGVKSSLADEVPTAARF
jgi:glycosyltransferase involved in cell wall biosynthesis